MDLAKMASDSILNKQFDITKKAGTQATAGWYPDRLKCGTFYRCIKLRKVDQLLINYKFLKKSK